MGCAGSKRTRCRHCQSPITPVPRSYSMHVHHPPQAKGDSYHVVALTSTTLGSLKLEIEDQNHPHINGFDKADENYENCNVDKIDERRKEFSMGVIEAKTWSNMINERIPKIVPRTPIQTPPGEPETINTWELMAGLEDKSPLRPLNHFRSFSFNVARDPIDDPFDQPKPNLQENGSGSPKFMTKNDSKSNLLENGSGSPKFMANIGSNLKILQENKPMWLQMADDDSNAESIIPEFDPDVISTFRKSLEELPPDNPFHLQPLDSEKTPANEDAKKVTNGVILDYRCNKNVKDKVVVYFTSLRGVRKTYEDCCHVRVILKSLGVRVDERDVSLHSGFKEELKELLGDGFNGGSLPRVFVGRRHIGGANEIRQLHEDGQLEKVLEGCEMVDDGDCGGGGGGICEACGDIRFVPCETCSGSCKIYYDYDDDHHGDEDEEGEDDCEYGFQRCPDCNENGLIRCPICCY